MIVTPASLMVNLASCVWDHGTQRLVSCEFVCPSTSRAPSSHAGRAWRFRPDRGNCYGQADSEELVAENNNQQGVINAKPAAI